MSQTEPSEVNCLVLLALLLEYDKHSPQVRDKVIQDFMVKSKKIDFTPIQTLEYYEYMTIKYLDLDKSVWLK